MAKNPSRFGGALHGCVVSAKVGQVLSVSCVDGGVFRHGIAEVLEIETTHGRYGTTKLTCRFRGESTDYVLDWKDPAVVDVHLPSMAELEATFASVAVVRPLTLVPTVAEPQEKGLIRVVSS